MKKLVCLLMTLCMTFGLGVNLAFAQPAMLLEYDGTVHEYTGSIYDLAVNGRQLELPLAPIIFNDRAVVPVREIFEAVGARVEYTGENQQIDIFSSDTYIRMKINDNTAYVNGRKQMIPDNVVPKLISKVGESAKTMVPVRFISETIGMEVDFVPPTISIVAQGYEMVTPAPEITPAPTVPPTPVPTQAPAPVPTPVSAATITNLTYAPAGANQLNITATANGPLGAVSKFTLSNPNRLVVDIANTQKKTSLDTFTVNQAGVSKIRLGYDEGRTRIVVDADTVKDYRVSANGAVLNISITTGGTVSTPPPAVTATPKPTAKPTPKPTQKPSVPPASASEKLIVIDPGHGGHDGGADSTYQGKPVYEKDLTLAISKKLRSILEQNGYKVLMTREGDTYPTLDERPAMANEANAALFVSVHINSVENAPSASGTEVWYAPLNNSNLYGTTSQKLASNILSSMVKTMGTKNRGVKTSNHAVTRQSKMPACLVEVGFITNEEEVGKMLDENFQQKVAQGIADGIIATMPSITVPSN